MADKIGGSCLCGSVTFEVEDDFSMFYLCHCSQCQQISGSSYASNIFTQPENIRWITGESSMSRYDHPSRDFTKLFCSSCGSGLPFVTKSGKYLVVPSGSLSRQPTIKPQANLFWPERAVWYDHASGVRQFNGFPE